MKNGVKRTTAAILAALILASTGAATVAMTGVGASVVFAETATLTVKPLATGDVDSDNDGVVTSGSTTYYITLDAAIKAATAGDTITLADDITLTSKITIPSDKTITLDLGGYKLSRADGCLLDVYGNLTLKNGTIEMTGSVDTCAIWLNQTAKVDIASDVTIQTEKPDRGTNYDYRTGDANWAIGLWSDCTAAELNFAGKIDAESGITINGIATSVNNEVNIQSGSSINVKNTGLYLAGAGVTTIIGDDTKIEGNTGIEIRAGQLTIGNGATITGGTGTTNVTANGDGQTTTNAALAIAQHTTKQAITVTINGGNFTGTTAINEANPQNNETEYIKNVNLTINGGNFTGTVSSADCKNFITGGTFSSDPTQYLATGYTASQTSDATTTGYYKVTADNTKIDATTGLPAASNDTITITQSGNYKLTDEISNPIVVEEGVVTTLDLNGHTISTPTSSLEEDQPGESIDSLITVNGMLTVTDSSTGTAGKISTADTAIMVNGGTLNVEKGTITSTSGMAITVSGGTANISGGTISGAMGIFGDGNVNVSGGSIVATESFGIYLTSGTLTITNAPTISTGDSDTHAVELVAGATVKIGSASETNLENNSYLTFTENTTPTLHQYTSIDDATVTVSGDLTYTGSEITPNIEVELNGTTLTEDKDYTVFYSRTNPDGDSESANIEDGELDLTSAGTVYVTITGVGDYTGTVEKTFAITKASQTAQTAAPTEASKTSTSVTLNEISTTGYDTVQYAISTSDSVPTDGWQESAEFTSLTPNTTYYFYARYAGDDNHDPSSASAGIAIKTLASYTVTYDGNGATTGTVPTQADIDAGGSFTVADGTGLSKDGYIFAGWKMEGDNDTVYTKDSNISDVSSNIKLVAQWTLATPTITDTAGYTATYDGNDHDVSVTVNEGEGITYTYQWYRGDAAKDENKIANATNATYSVKDVSDSGTYYCMVTATDSSGTTTTTSGEITVSISKADPIVTPPTAKTGLTYNGTAQELVTAGTATGGTLQYKLGSGDYGTSVPTATASGTYTVAYKVVGDSNYNDTAEQSISVTINPRVTTDTPTTTAPTVTTNEDGSTTTTTTKTEDGATVTTATDKDANGNVTGSTETKEEKKSDGSTVTTETKKDADGKVTQKTETTVAKDTTTNTTTETTKTENADGTKSTETVKKVDENNKVLSETTKETEVDKAAEQQTEVLTEKKEDGSVVKTTTTSSTKEGDQSATIVEEKAAENSKGSTVEQTTITVVDTTGKTTSVTEEHKIDNVGNSTNATVTVAKDGDGNVQEATAEVEKTGATKEDGVQATFTNKVVSQLKEAAGDAAKDLTITMTVKDENGDDHHSITAKVDDLTPNNTLYIYKQDENGNYVMVNAKEYTTDAKGQLKTTIKSKSDFVLLNEQEANAATKAVLSTVKASKTAASVKKSKTTTMKLDSGLNMANVKNITYKTSKSSVATVDKKTGKITAKKAGKATVSAVVTLKNGTKKTVKMTVNVK